MRYALNGKYPIETKEQLIKTADYFNRYLTKFHPKERVLASVAIEKRASELNVNIDHDWITNYARPYESQEVSPDFEQNMQMRKQASIGKTVTINKQSVAADKMLDIISNNLEKLGNMAVVDQLFAFDKAAQLEYQWDKILADPFLTVFGSLRNPEFDAVKIAGSVTDYELKKIACDSNAINNIKRIMGNTVARNFIDSPVTTISKMSSMNKEAFLNAIGKS